VGAREEPSGEDLESVPEDGVVVQEGLNAHAHRIYAPPSGEEPDLNSPPPSSCLHANYEISAMPPPALRCFPCTSPTGALP
jgi:hypothetical protein